MRTPKGAHLWGKGDVVGTILLRYSYLLFSRLKDVSMFPYPFPLLALSAGLVARQPASSFPAICAMRPGINFSKMDRHQNLMVPAENSVIANKISHS